MRGVVHQRIEALFPERHALVEALVLARREGIDGDVRERWSRTGTAHLLAISGFHVGVIAGVLYVLARVMGLGPGRAPLVAALGSWIYVLAIGAPVAAARAASILGALASGRLVGRRVSPVGALASTFLIMLCLRPGAMGTVAFQLSFAGAAGLILLGPAVRGWLATGASGRLPGSLRSGIASGVSATVATLPLVAWHFGRVSVVGIPATLMAGPLLAVAIPGIFASILLSFVSPVAAGFAAGAAGALIAWPVPALMGWGGAVELIFLDVGQGDAVAVRTPRDRWLLIDTGPRSPRYDAGARVVVPYLRGRGASVLEALVLTHPDLDHIGGAEAVFSNLEVRRVLDPARPAGRSAYVTALERARRSGAVWLAARAGDRLSLDGVTLEVLHPGGEVRGRRERRAERPVGRAAPPLRTLQCAPYGRCAGRGRASVGGVRPHPGYRGVEGRPPREPNLDFLGASRSRPPRARRDLGRASKPVRASARTCPRTTGAGRSGDHAHRPGRHRESPRVSTPGRIRFRSSIVRSWGPRSRDRTP